MWGPDCPPRISPHGGNSMKQFKSEQASTRICPSLLRMPRLTSLFSAVPFGGTVSGQCHVSLIPGYRIVSIAGSGEFLHLGATTELSTVTVSTTQLLSDGCSPESRTTTLTAANGDQLYIQGSGETCPNSTSNDQWWIVGGTGRFAGASGSGTESGVRTFLSFTPPSGVATLTYSGWVSSPGTL